MVTTSFKRASALAYDLEGKLNRRYKRRKAAYKSILGSDYMPAHKSLYLAYPNGKAASEMATQIEWNSAMLAALEHDDVMCQFGSDKRWRCWAIKNPVVELWTRHDGVFAGEVWAFNGSSWRKIGDQSPYGWNWQYPIWINNSMWAQQGSSKIVGSFDGANWSQIGDSPGITWKEEPVWTGEELWVADDIGYTMWAFDSANWSQISPNPGFSWGICCVWTGEELWTQVTSGPKWKEIWAFDGSSWYKKADDPGFSINASAWINGEMWVTRNPSPYAIWAFNGLTWRQISTPESNIVMSRILNTTKGSLWQRHTDNTVRSYSFANDLWTNLGNTFTWTEENSVVAIL